MRIKLYFFLVSIDFALGKFTRIVSKPANIVFKYPEGVSGETTLKECQVNQVCNVVHKRFWMPNLAERLCRCPDADECPWSEKLDNFSISLNNRSVLKFCQSIGEKKKCKARQNAAVVRGEISEDYSVINPRSLTVNCVCPENHFWKLKKYDFFNNKLHQVFRCSKQRMCESYDFCGFIRSDMFSTYYRCSCPEGNLCISKDKQTHQVQELMYLGPSYRAYCHPWNATKRHWH